MTNSSTAPNFHEVVRLAEKAMKFWQVGENQQSSEVLKELVALDPYSALWPTLLARTKLLEGATKEALDVADEALNIRGLRQADLFLLRAQANLKLDASTTGSQTARKDLLSARALGVLNVRAATELAEALATLGLSPQNEVKPSPSVVVETPKVQAPKAVAPKVVTACSEPKNGNAALAQVLEAREAELKGHYLKARGHCAEALKLSAHLPEAVLCLARIHLQNREASAVGKLFKAHPSVLQRGAASYIQAMSLKAAAAEQEGDWDTASEELEAVTKVAQQEDESKAKATKPGWAPQPKLEDLMGRLARARWRSGEKQTAINLAQSMLELAPNQRQACEVACAILLERGESGTALALMVRCLIANRHDGTASNADFVIGVMRQCSVEELSHVLAPKEEDLSKEQSTSIAEVIGYIGLILKERGESLESCRLYRKAVVLAPDHGSLCLNLMHAFSIRRDDLRALAWGERFFDGLVKKIPKIKSFGEVLRGKSSSSETSTPLFVREDFDNEATFHDAIAIAFVCLKLIFLGHSYQHPFGNQLNLSDAIDLKPAWQLNLQKIDIEKELVSPKVVPLTDEFWFRPGEVAVEKLPAAAFQAHRHTLERLVNGLEGSRKGRDLHLTPVRNEHAYFGCISEIIRRKSFEPPPSIDPTSVAPIFVVGDSHVLPCAWQTLDLPASEGEGLQRHILIPNLVTGAKLWHLKEQSTFYTKFMFWERISNIPVGAPVILILGEIDCREGILLAVQKGRHESLEAALQAVVDIYLNILKEVRKKLRSSPIFVHPIANVLPETRFLTVAFNILLTRPASVEVMTKARINLLQFDNMFTGLEDGTLPNLDASQLSKLELLPELRLDGTHLSPTYVTSHLSPALSRAWASSRED